MEEIEAKLAAVEQRLQNLTAKIHERVVTKGFDATPGPRTDIDTIPIWRIGVQAGDFEKYGFRVDSMFCQLWSEKPGYTSKTHTNDVLFVFSRISLDSIITQTELLLAQRLTDGVFAEFILRRPKCMVSIGSGRNSYIMLKNGTANTTIIGKKDKAR